MDELSERGWGGLDREVGGLVVGLLGAAATVVPLFDIWADIGEGKPIGSTFLENAPLLAFALVVVGAGAWLARSNWHPSEVRTIVAWTVGAVALATTVFTLVISVQLYLQGDLKPFVIAADAVLIAALGGLAIGVRTAERQQAERRRFRGLFEHVPNPIAETRLDDDGAMVERVNPAFTNVFGYRQPAIVGEPLEEYIVPPDSDVEPLADEDTDLDLPPEDIWNRDVIELETVDGRREFVRLAVPADAGYGPSGYGIYIDVTPQRQRQERLEVLARILRHDIRNRVNVIDSYANYLAERGDWDDPPEQLAEIREAAADLHALGERTRIAEDLAVESTDQRVVDLVGTVEVVVDRVTNTREANVDASLPSRAYVRGTEDLATAIIEVVENAIAHSDGEEPNVEITGEATYDGDYFEISVSDDGPGIPADQYEVVTGERERTQVEHANGIGLWLAYWICRACGGELAFDVTDHGSVVTLRIPAADPDGAPEPVVSSPRRNRRPGSR